MKATACKSCGAPVIWAEFASGKKAPFDAEAVPRGTKGSWALVEESVGVKALKATDQDDEVYVSHFSSCPQSVGWRKS